MKLRRESAESGDFSGTKGEFKKLFSGRNRIKIPSGRKIVFWKVKLNKENMRTAKKGIFILPALFFSLLILNFSDFLIQMTS